MVRAQWQDDLAIKVFVSYSGDFVSLGTRTEYPFTSGGPNGVPLGWTRYDSGGALADVNMSVGSGRYNISNAGTNSHQGNYYGAYRDFTIKANKRYIIQLQARVMDNKTAANRNVRYEMPIGTGQGVYSMATMEWENLAMPTGSSGAATTLRIVLQAIYYDPVANATDWGIQFTNLAIIEQDLTYPPPQWREVTCDVRSYATRFGRDRFTSRYDVASLSLAVNNHNGEFSYKPDGWLRPGRFIWVTGMRHGSYQQSDQFYGIIDSLTDSYTLDGRVYTTIAGIDISSLLSNQTVPTSSWLGSEFKSGNRFRRVLDSVGWHPSFVTADVGQFTQQAVMANGRTVRDELGLIADSEGGYFFANRSGYLEYHDRNWEGYYSAVRAELLAQPEPEPLPYVEAVRFTFPGYATNYVRMVDPPPNVPGDIELIARVSFDHVTDTTKGHESISGRYSNINDYAYLLLKLNDGRLQTYLGGTGAAISPVLPFANDEMFWLKVNRQVSSGRVRFYTAPDQDSVPTNWTQFGNDQTASPGVPPAQTQHITILGAFGAAGTSYPMSGIIRRFIINNGIDGPPVLDIDDANAYGLAGSGGTYVEFPATTGQTVQAIPPSVIKDAGYYPVLLPPVDPIPTVDDPTIICTNELQTIWSRDRIVNEIQIANQGGSAYTKIDGPSQKKYGPRSYQRMDFLNVNSDPTYNVTRANDIMTGYTEAILRVNSIRFRPKANAYEWASDVFLHEMVRVRYVHPSMEWGFSVVSRVQGIEHTVTAKDWTVMLMLDQPIAYRDWGGGGDLGNGWDQGLWDVNMWDETPGTHWSTGDRWSIEPAAWEA